MKNLRSEILTLVFGMLIILIIFGDAGQADWVGNLDTIFGLGLGHLMDVIYPVAAVSVFLLYGKSKGALRVKAANIWLFLIFLAAIIIMQVDDIFVVFNNTRVFPEVYWIIVRCVFFAASTSTFFLFGRSCKNDGADKE